MVRGPVPKRSDQRRRRNKSAADAPAVVVAMGQQVVKPPTEDRAWHPYAKDWFRALKRSGQAQFYQESDWREAKLVAWLITQELSSPTGARAGMMDVIFSRADALMTTEGARRRLRVELITPKVTDEAKEATVSIMEQYRADLA
ncbi:phage terminase small subunit [Corynebacterium matruchotii]